MTLEIQYRRERALADYSADGKVHTLFEGVSYGTFDGELKEVDLRSIVASAKLILRAGKVELDCICNSVTVDNLRDALDKRVTVSAKAFYNGKDRLPEQIDIKKIEVLDRASNLTKWRSAFDLPPESREEVW